MWNNIDGEYSTTHFAGLADEIGPDVREREAAPVHQVVEHERTAIIKQLDKVLCMFHFIDTRGVRAMMAASGAVISGSAALSILHPDRFIINDLDFFVTAKGYPTLLAFVLDHGYKVSIADVPSVDYADTNIVLTLIHAASRASINIVASMDSHVVGTITQFHSTVVMNYIAFYGVVCLYPMWTMKNAGLVVVREAEKRGCIQKYRARGYTMAYKGSAMPNFDEGHCCGQDPTCPRTRRTLHDGHSLFVPFDNIPAHLPSAEATMVRWTLPAPCDSVS